MLFWGEVGKGCVGGVGRELRNTIQRLNEDLTSRLVLEILRDFIRAPPAVQRGINLTKEVANMAINGAPFYAAPIKNIKTKPPTVKQSKMEEIIVMGGQFAHAR
jgi:hypothetical protein